MADEQTAVSSTASDDPSVAALAENDFERYSELENARELAAKGGKAPTEASPASSEPAAESEPAKQVQEKRPKNAETRKAEIQAEIAELLRQRAELQGKIPPGEKPADPPPAPEKPKEAKAAEAEAPPTKPKLEDFENWQQFDEAKDAYTEQLAAYRAREAVREALAAARQQEAADAANKAIETSLAEAQAEARAEFSDFNEVALAKTVPISKAMDGWILKNLPVSMKVLYRLGENDGAEAKRIAALDVFDQVDALAEIRATFRQQQATPVKKHTTAAPAPATELGGRNTVPADKARAALLTGDFSSYEREANLRDAQAQRG